MRLLLGASSVTAGTKLLYAWFWKPPSFTTPYEESELWKWTTNFGVPNTKDEVISEGYGVTRVIQHIFTQSQTEHFWFIVTSAAFFPLSCGPPSILQLSADQLWTGFSSSQNISIHLSSVWRIRPELSPAVWRGRSCVFSPWRCGSWLLYRKRDFFDDEGMNETG